MAMKPNITAIERAFELANTGRFLYVQEIRERLRAEGYHTDVITGPKLWSQLRDAIAATLRQQHKPQPQMRTPRADL